MRSGGCRFLPGRGGYWARRFFEAYLWGSRLWTIPAVPGWGFGLWNGRRFLHKKYVQFLLGRAEPSPRCFLPESRQGPDACRIPAVPGRKPDALDAGLWFHRHHRPWFLRGRQWASC